MRLESWGLNEGESFDNIVYKLTTISYLTHRPMAMCRSVRASTLSLPCMVGGNVYETKNSSIDLHP